MLMKTLVALMVTLVVSPVAMAGKKMVDDESGYTVWSASRIASNPYGKPSANLEDAAGYFNQALLEGVVAELLDCEINPADRLTAKDVIVDDLPAKSVISMMCGKKKGKLLYDKKLITNGVVQNYTTWKWCDAPLGLIAACSNIHNAVRPRRPERGLQGEKGEKGDPGIAGEQGLLGPQGLAGVAGKDGWGFPWKPVLLVGGGAAVVGGIIYALTRGGDKSPKGIECSSCRSPTFGSGAFGFNF